MARSAAPKEDDEEGASLVVHYMAEDDGLTVDEALTLAGGWSHYQHKLILTLGCVQAASSSHMLAPIFLIPRLTADWQLTAGQASLLSSLFFAGYCVGVVVWSWFSDSYGRRPATALAFGLGNLSGVASFLAPNYTTFVLLRFLCGVGIAGAKNGVFMLGTEFAPPSARARVGALVSYAWLCGLLFLVFSAWLLQDLGWRYLIFTYVPAMLVQLLLTSQLPESPRFSLVAAEPERAKQTLLAVFDANGRQPPEPLTLRRPPTPRASAPAASATSTSSSNNSFAQLWAPATRRMTLIVGFCQGVCTMVFYAITFDPSTNAAAGNLYLGALLGALVELPAYLMLEPLTNTFGRRRSYCGFLALSALFLLILDHALMSGAADAGGGASASRLVGAAEAAAMEQSASVAAQHTNADETRRLLSSSHHAHSHHVNWLAVVCGLGGRFASVAATNVAYIVAAELFPTTCRNSAVGWGSGCGRIGAMAAPAIMLSTDRPLLLFVCLSAIAAVLVMVLPESAGATLADVPEGVRSDPPTPRLGTAAEEVVEAGTCRLPPASSGG